MLQVINEDIWKYYDQGKWIVITTNGFVKNNGECVMGRGIAKQAKERYPLLPTLLGKQIKQNGNVVHVFPMVNMVSFPVKFNWWEQADLRLIELSAVSLRVLMDAEKLKVTSYGIPTPLYLTKVGCGNGKLKWADVQPILERYLDDRFVICDKEGLTE